MWEISFVNMTMLLATIPVFKTLNEEDNESEKKEEEKGNVGKVKEVESLVDLGSFLGIPKKKPPKK